MSQAPERGDTLLCAGKPPCQAPMQISVHGLEFDEPNLVCLCRPFQGLSRGARSQPTG
jgi:hypothetical protein